jgi:hypothetical protein
MALYTLRPTRTGRVVKERGTDPVTLQRARSPEVVVDVPPTADRAAAGLTGVLVAFLSAGRDWS